MVRQKKINMSHITKKNVFLQPQKRRGVAQLVARYVRDVEAGSSSLLTPTNKKGNPMDCLF